MKGKIISVALILCILFIFYYSWLPDASLYSETYLPKWIINWSNENYNLRTAVPFILLGFLLEELSFLVLKVNYKQSTFSIRKLHLGFTLLVVLIAETGQIFCGRNPDVLDVGYGFLGSFIGGIIYYLCKKLIQLF